MASTIARCNEYLRGPEGVKMFRYSMASVVALATSVVCLGIFSGVLSLSAWVASSLATAIATIPSYYLNRKWAWGKDGKSHFWREIMPFWGLAFIGWGFSTLCSDMAESVAKNHHFSHLARTGTVEVVYVAAFGVLWVGKFIIFNKLIFVHHGHAVDAVEPLDVAA